MEYKHIIFLGCSFTQMKTFIHDPVKGCYIDRWFAEPDWTKLVAEWTGLRHKNVGESGKGNGSMLMQYLKAKASLPPKDKCIVVGGMTVTTRMTFRGYAGINTFRGDPGEDNIGTKQWENMIVDDGFVWQNVVDLGQLSEQVRELGDQLFVFENHCEMTQPTFIDSLHTFITKYHTKINWGQPDINILQLAREGLEVISDRMLNKIPPGFEPIKDYMNSWHRVTDEQQDKLKESLEIIATYSRVEQWHMEKWIRNNIGDPGLNFNALQSYFEENENSPRLKISHKDGHPNQTGSNLLAEYVYYNLTQHELLKNMGFDPFIGTRYLRYL